MARAMWKGRLVVAKAEVPVKMYSAVQEHTVHFRLLEAGSLTPVRQRIVRKSDGEEVDRKDQRKAVAVDEERLVVFTPEELAELEPEASREVDLCRFVPRTAVSDPWFDRPYFLGPDGDEDAYFALAEALAEKEVLGIARWVMRKKRYVGALAALDGYLTLVTLRRAEQVLALPGLAAAPKVDAKELKLGEQLVESIAADFDPSLWQDEYHERVCKLIEAKAAGEKVKLLAPKKKRAGGSLADQLARSLKSMKERKAA